MKNLLQSLSLLAFLLVISSSILTAQFTAPTDLCIDAGALSDIGGGIPIGGVYSGPGVIDDGNGTTYSFNPAVAGVGVHSITYTNTSLPMYSQLGLDIDGEAAGDQSGHSVSISANGNRVAIGAHRNDGGGIDAGQVRVYEWTGTVWTQLGLDIDGESGFYGTGFSISLSSDGNRMAIGAVSNFVLSGKKVRVYEWTGSTWVQLGNGIDGETINDGSGWAVSLSSDGSRIAIGSPLNDDGGNNAGQVRIYDWSGIAWIQLGNDIDGEAPGDDFGRFLALSSDGTRVAIGARGNDGLGAARIYEWTGSAWVQLGDDIAGEVLVGGSYSVSISSNGNRVAIGAYKNRADLESIPGQVRIYEWTGSIWVQLGDDIDGEAPRDNFGFSMSLSSDGSRVAIGAYNNDGGGTNAGQVVTYDWTGTEWAQFGQDLYGEASSDYFGTSVSLSSDGSTVAVGAPFNAEVGSAAGHVRVYCISPGDLTTNSVSDDIEVFALPVTTFTAPTDLCIDAGVQSGLGGATPAGGVYSGPGVTDDGNGTTYAFDPAAAGVDVHSLTYTYAPSLFSQLGLDIDGEAAGDNSGWSVSLSSDGNRVAIGARDNDGEGVNSGHVRVYEWSGTAWMQLGQDIDDGEAGARSGWVISLSSDGSRVAIGAPFARGEGNILGRVRTYEWSGTAWVQLGQDLTGQTSTIGLAVSLSPDGNRLAIGNLSPRRARIYEWSGTAWVQLGQDLEGQAGFGQFGRAVSLSSDGNRVAIADHNNNGGPGYVRCYGWSGTAWVRLGFDLEGEADGDQFGWSVSLSSDGNRVAIGGYNNEGAGVRAGHARIYEWSGTAWAQLGLDLDAEAAENEFGWSVSLSSDGNRVAIGAPDNDGGGELSGHVRIYDWSGTAWTQFGQDIDGEEDNDRSGWSVSLSSDGSRVAIGAIYNGGQGQVRVYSIGASCTSSATDDVEVFPVIPESACPGALPVELITFTGRTAGKRNVLEWTAAREEDFSRYELERSASGTANWEFLGAVAGAGQAEQAQAYTYPDVAPPNSAYYRLRMVDLDGSFAYSNIVHLEHATAAGELVIYPNPNNGQFTVQLPTDESATLSLYDLSGKLVWQREIPSNAPSLTQSRSSSEASIGSIPDGVYLFTATTASNRWTERIVIR